MRLEPVIVLSRLGKCPGARAGNVVVYEWPIPSESGATQRIYVLLDEHVQLQQPHFLRGEQAGWWYVDLIESSVETTGDGTVITIRDLYVDLIVPPAGPGYRVLDLEELGAALLEQQVTPTQAARVLAATQAFLDTHLQRPGSADGSHPDFPPTALAAVTSADVAAVADTWGR